MLGAMFDRERAWVVTLDAALFALPAPRQGRDGRPEIKVGYPFVVCILAIVQLNAVAPVRVSISGRVSAVAALCLQVRRAGSWLHQCATARVTAWQAAPHEDGLGCGE